MYHRNNILFQTIKCVERWKDREANETRQQQKSKLSLPFRIAIPADGYYFHIIYSSALIRY